MILLETNALGEIEADEELIEEVTPVLGTPEDVVEVEVLTPESELWETIVELAVADGFKREDIETEPPEGELSDSHGYLKMIDTDTGDTFSITPVDEEDSEESDNKLLQLELRYYDDDRTHFVHFRLYTEERELATAYALDFFHQQPLDLVDWDDVTDEFIQEA